jgi:hypothetical protein
MEEMVEMAPPQFAMAEMVVTEEMVRVEDMEEVEAKAVLEGLPEEQVETAGTVDRSEKRHFL